MARLPSRAGPGLVCYTAVVQPLGAVLSNGAAPIGPGQWHSVRPPHGTPGTAILTRPEARAGPVTHAQKPRRKRKWWAVCWLLGSVLIPMAAERESDSAELPGSEALLDAVLRTLYDLGERISWEEAAKGSEMHPKAAGPRATRFPGAMPTGGLFPAAPPSPRPFHLLLGRPFALLLTVQERKIRAGY